MTRINLLPKPQRPSVWPKAEYILWTMGVLAVVITLALTGFNYYELHSLELELKEIDEQKLLLKPTAANMEQAKKTQQTIENKAGLLVKLTGERVSFNAVLIHISDITPPRVWLTEIEAKVNFKDGQENTAAGNTALVILKGKALTYPDIADFMGKIEQDEQITNPLLLKVEKVDSFGNSQFEISLEIKIDKN